MTQTFARLAPASVAVQVCSFGSSIVFAHHLGATTRTDAYYLALSIPVVVYAVLLAGIKLGGIPTLTEIAQGESPASLNRACSELLTAAIVASALLSLAVTTLMLLVLPRAAGGGPQLATYTRQFLLELAPYSVTGAMLGALGAILAVRDRFAAATAVLAIEPVLKSSLLLLFGRQLGVQALVVGNLAGNVLAVSVLWRCVRRQGVALRMTGFPRSPAVRSIVVLSAPLVLSQAALQLNPLIDRSTAGAVGPGAITQLEMGMRLFSAPTALLTGMMIAPLVASWSARMSTDGWSAVTRGFSRATATILCLLPPMIVLGYVLRHELVALIYSSRRYTPTDVRHTADVFGMLLLGLIPQILIVLAASLFVVKKDTVFPLKVGLANCALNAVLDVALRGPLGVAGIALSTTVTITLLFCVFIGAARSRWGRLRLWPELRLVFVLSIGAAVAAGVITTTLGTVIAPTTRLADLATLCGAAAAVIVTQIVIMTAGGAWQRAGLPITTLVPRRIRGVRSSTAG
jgi:putative peptidoglycan lipid II flippase